MTDLERDRLARVVLNQVAEPGDPRYAPLVAEMGAPGLVEALKAECDLQGAATDGSARLAAVHPERELELAARIGARFVIPGDPDWPRQLGGLDQAPLLHDRGLVPLGLWVRGPLNLTDLDRSVAIVGSRNATTYGGEIACDLGAGIAMAGLPIVSGGAMGIDIAAHRGALSANGPTVVVLACGVDRAYPTAHQGIFDRVIQQGGAIISESPLGTAPLKIRFLSRNRVIAGLTRATVIVEAAIRSGALNTANWANGLNRPVAGIPGPINSVASSGVHQLLRRGGATLATNAEEVLELAGLSGEHLSTDLREVERPRDRLSAKEQQILDAVPVSSGAHADSIARVAGLGLLEVRSALARLKAKGFIEDAVEGWRLARAESA